jgi:putative transcriptional regulator
MIIRSHPQASTLMSHASGALPGAISGVIACHLSMCEQCRADIRILDMVGGLMLEGMASPRRDEFAEAQAVKRALERDAPPSEPPPRLPPSEDFLPSPLARYLGMNGEDIPWQRLPKGIRQYWIGLPPGSGHMRILRIPPGAQLLEHSHGGMEATIILRGTYSDHTGDYERGDVSEMTDGTEHYPSTVSSTEECICIVANEAMPRYSRWYARLFQPLLGY